MSALRNCRAHDAEHYFPEDELPLSGEDRARTPS